MFLGVGAVQLRRSRFAAGALSSRDISVEPLRRVGFCQFCPETQGSLSQQTVPHWDSVLVTPTQPTFRASLMAFPGNFPRAA